MLQESHHPHENWRLCDGINGGEPDAERHALYIDGVQVYTRLLDQGQSEVVTFYSEGEAAYNYYDYGKQEDPLGQIHAVKVIMYE